MTQSGIGNDTTVVMYGDNNNWFAAWAFWQMKIYGHKDVRLMNGGRKKWLAEGRDLETAAAKPSPSATPYKATEPDYSLRAFLPQVQQAQKPASAVMVDVRSPQEFTRRNSGASRTAGNLPARRPHSRRAQHAVGQSVQ